jgi:hypothetical protein
MIWWTLALFVVSFLVTALLAPKPEIENSRADSLDNVDFPRATEDAPIPLVLGKVRFNAPNTIWYGDFSSVAITERIKVSPFKKITIIVGYRYYLGLDLALAMGPGVQLHEILIDDTSVWTGSTSTTVPTTGTINAESLFGGYKNGGGFVSPFTYYPGSFTQPVNSYLEAQIGAGNVPAYRGLSHIVLEKALIGESSQLRKTSFILSSYSNAIGAPNSGKVGDDMNPMEAIYQVMTDKWRGLGVDPSLIDFTNFSDASVVLHAEGNGVSILVTAASTGKTVISEILRQIDAIMYQDPETGKFRIKLVRFDYDPDDLPVFDEDDVLMIRNFSKTSWEDVIAQVKVSFPNRDKESTSVAISMDQATASMIGRLKTSTLSFPFCYDPVTANAIASRERATSSVPLFRATIEMNRNGYSLRPGDVFKLNWPEYGIAGVVFRVQKHDLGSLMDNKIVLECLQDSFAQSTVVFSPPAISAWVPVVTTPAAITTFQVAEMPRFLAKKIEFPIPDGFGSIIPLPAKPAVGSSSFDMLAGIATGVLTIRNPEQVEYPVTATFQAVYAASAGLATGLDGTGFVVENIVGTFDVPTTDDILNGDGGLLYANGEWMTYSGVSGSGATRILSGIRRAVLGSLPVTHSLGSRLFVVTPEVLGSGILGDDLTETGTAFYKLLDRVGPQVYSEGLATQYSYAMLDLADRPARPRNVQIAGSRAVNVTTAVARTCTWVASNREASTITFEQDATQTPDQTETYDLEVYFNGVLQAGLSATNVASGFSIPFNTLVGPLTVANAEVRVRSRRTVGDLKSSPYYAWLPFTVNIP